MEITQQVREYAKQQGLDAEAAIETGMPKKSSEFREGGAEIYNPA